MLKILDFYGAHGIMEAIASIDAPFTRKPGEFL